MSLGHKRRNIVLEDLEAVTFDHLIRRFRSGDVGAGPAGRDADELLP